MYREPAPKELEPLETLKVKDTQPWAFYAVILVFTLLFGFGLYGTVHVDCVRPARGASARCTAVNASTFKHQDAPSFTLERGSIRATKATDSRNHTFTVLMVDGNRLDGPAIDFDFARQTAADADRFYEDEQKLEWHAGRTARLASMLSFVIGLVLIGGMRWLCRTTTLAIDPNRKVLIIGKETYPLHQIDRLHTSTHRGTASLSARVGQRGMDLCSGVPKCVEAAEVAIRKAIERGV
jgi:hypothetical protein